MRIIKFTTAFQVILLDLIIMFLVFQKTEYKYFLHILCYESRYFMLIDLFTAYVLKFKKILLAEMKNM